ncbi:MAG: TonB-dependent receptor, partial [Tidjanibacter sp.]|nr:TonB-dependent receptor [Tidjanibacter sp.]
RYTTDGATTEAGGSVPPYAMNDLSLSRALSLSWADVTLRFEVKNLFDIEYESVLAHPMPGRNFGFFIELTPKL